MPDSVIEANIKVLIVSKIGLINTGIILSSNIIGRLTPPTGPKAVVKVFS